MKSLFRSGNKIDIKGKKVSGLLQRLDIMKIMENVHSELDELVSILNS